MVYSKLKTMQKSLGTAMNRSDLHHYQLKAIEHIQKYPNKALWMDMGLGKTISTLTAIVDLMDRFDCLQVLIIAPRRVAHTTWPTEIESWEHTKALSYQVIKGTPSQRLEQIKCFKDLHIVSRDLVEWLVDVWGSKWPYDMVVIDEASSFKSNKANRFKALRRALPYIQRMVQLTGTPSSNGLLDIWPQLYLLDQGKRLGKTFSRYRAQYFDHDYFKYKWWPKAGSEQLIYTKLSDICLTLSAEDYLQMPKRIDNVISIDLTEKEREQYKVFEHEFLLKLESESVVAVNSAVLANKLLQYCNGALYLESTNDKPYQEIHNHKLDALEAIIDELQGEPVLVAYNFKSDLIRLKKRFKNAVTLDDVDDILERWNAGDIPILLAHPASAGHGLNLQKGGNNIVWFGLNWSLELYQQFNARLYRQGQAKPVFIHHLVVTNSVDQTVMKAVKGKHKIQSALLNALKDDVIQRHI
jgi:SNF2 family DNA or RNA helicase